MESPLNTNLRVIDGSHKLFIGNYDITGFVASLAAGYDIGGFANDVNEFPFALYYNYSVAREENA